MVLLTVCVATGCSTTQRYDESHTLAWPTTIRNPFDLQGPEFLGLFAAGFACAVVIAALLRCLFRRSDNAALLESPELDPYEAAYLAGGEQGAVHSVLASLVNQGMLKCDAANRRLILTETDDGTDSLHPVERDVLETIDEQGVSLDELEERLWWCPSQIADRLKSLDLIVRDERDHIGRVVPTMFVLLVPLLGVNKILVGLSNEKPVGFLVIACIVATIVAFAGFGRRLHRTWEGDRALGRLKSDHAALQHKLDESATSNVPLAVGLFGIGVLAGGSLDEFHTALKPKVESGGYGGGGCDGGGGCGGCGGCG